MSDETPNDSPSRVIPRQIADEMNEAFLSYSMSVIVQRALPDVRDGLKPVHRRILFAMHELGLAPGRGYKKSATVVGDVLGKYHPHGDSAVYDSMVRMAQDFSMRYPLVDGQGNFGSIDGDPAAAYRYTEARLTRVATEMLSDIDKDTVDFRPNYDDRLTEPTVLPSRAPNLLVNGSSGIAVGMATNIPPHNLREVVAACIHLIDHPDATALDLHTLIPGPDFPTGATIHGVNGIREAYETGRGRVVMRARATIEEVAGREKIVIHEIPYMVNKARLVENIAELVREKKIEGISDLRDESDRDGMRITIGIKRDAIGQIVLNSLYKHTSMQSTFGVIMLALVNDVPRVLNLREMIQCFVTHRHTIVVRRSEHDLGKARDREHILEGLKIAVDNIDEVVEIIRKSPTAEVAGDRLRERFELSEKQSDAILNMRLARLTGLEIEKLEEELTEVRAEITRLLEMLGSLEVRMGIIKEELREVSEQYGDDRRTEIVPSLDEISIEDLIADEEMVITVSHEGYIKRLASDSYRAQHRGGRGVTGMETKDEDWVEQVFVASTHDYLMCFTREGHCHWIKVHEIPQPSRAARGRPIVNLMGVQPDTRLAALVPVRIFATDRYLVFVTRKGKVKRTRLSEFRHVRAIGIRAIGIEEGDELIDVRISDDSKDVLIATRNGQAIRFRETDARIMGRPAAGVRGIDLVEGDEVVGSVVARSDARVLVATRKGMGKRTLLEDYRLQRRGGSGVKNLNLTERTGDVVAVKVAEDGDELVIVTRKGIVNRQTVDSIRVIGRNTQGVKLIALGTDDDSGISDEVVDVEIMAGAPEVAATGVAAIDDGDIVADDGVDTALVDDVVDDEASVDE